MKPFRTTVNMGGKRVGSGRKPDEDPCIPYTVRVRKSAVLQFGNKLIRKQLNEFAKSITLKTERP